MSDPEVKAIVIDVDSPGGTYPGIPELGREIYEARGAKGEGNIVAVANSLAASGALRLATAFERFMVTPSGEAGSVGAVMIHTELSKAFEDAGFTHTVFRRPDAKTERNIYEPLTAEAKEHAQKVIDEVYAEFVSAMARHRGVGVATVRSDFGQGAAAKRQGCRGGPHGGRRRHGHWSHHPSWPPAVETRGEPGLQTLRRP